MLKAWCEVRTGRIPGPSDVAEERRRPCRDRWDHRVSLWVGDVGEVGEFTLIHLSAWKGDSAKFGSSAVPGVLRGLLKMIAEIFRPLLCSLPRHANLPLFYAFFVVGDVPEFPGSPASVFRTASIASSMGSPGPLGPGLRLVHQDLVGHLFDASFFASRCALLFLAETLPQGRV